eukprot:CAMPEP_0194049928 /NCGR_PEP_ID=MMETSP0009_2-20130614/31956_1 /TAXON_ID=210454 /ORGANISM="Grammatophora oceanica, Strain CCMP 410" /LENGTH=66 /DNA_ID=CAMNT_0038696239 /DNA_START=36 /DNA_END=232 /DNA_ORIENTATION=-
MPDNRDLTTLVGPEGKYKNLVETNETWNVEAINVHRQQYCLPDGPTPMTPLNNHPQASKIHTQQVG